MKVIVLGAGVIGVTSAYILARRGYDVTVLEKQEKPGMGCSHANGGQLSYSHVETWAQKASLTSVFAEVFGKKSFLNSAALKDKELLAWASKFYLNSGKRKAHKNSENLFKISSLSQKILQNIIADEADLKFDYQASGTLHFFRKKKSFESAIRNLEFLDKIGCKSEILTAQDCVKKEPNLSRLLEENKLAGGIFFGNDASGNSYLYIKSLEKICREKYGVKFEYGADIKNILTNHKKITGINTSKGVFAGNNYVYALGAYDPNLLKGIGLKTDIYPLKGFSLSIKSNKDFEAPKIALTDSENKIVYSRIGNVFRAAGLVELGGFKAKENRKNINYLEQILLNSFSNYGNLNKLVEWSGFRPFRPNSIPLICQVKKYGNLFLNVGHGSLGWTLSAGSAEILADLIEGKKDKDFSFLAKEDYLI